LKVVYLFQSEGEVGNYRAHLNLQGHQVESAEVFLGLAGWKNTYLVDPAFPVDQVRPTPLEVNFTPGGQVRVEVEVIAASGGANLNFTPPGPGGEGVYETPLPGTPEGPVASIGDGTPGVAGQAAPPPIPA